MKKYYCSFWGDDAGESAIFHDIIEAKNIRDSINKLIKKWGSGFYSNDLESINECIRVPEFLQNKNDDEILQHYNKLYLRQLPTVKTVGLSCET